MEILKTKCGKEFFVDSDDAQFLKETYNIFFLSSGYVTVNLGQSKVQHIHKILCQSEADVDHINGNKLDNQKENLRACTRAQNFWNRPSYKGRKYKGIIFCTTTKKWRARIRINGKVLDLGRYDTEQKAAIAYARKAVEVQGKFVHSSTLELLRNG